MQEFSSTNELKHLKYKQFYLNKTSQASQENLTEQIAELKALRNDFQLQSDELLQSYKQQQKLKKKIVKLKQTNEELNQTISEFQTKIKTAVANRDTAIGEKFIIQKKYEELLNKQQSLFTEPVQQNVYSQEVKTESNAFDNVEQLKSQIQILEQRYVQIKMESNQ